MSMNVNNTIIVWAHTNFQSFQTIQINSNWLFKIIKYAIFQLQVLVAYPSYLEDANNFKKKM